MLGALQARITLNDGGAIPKLGLGVWQTPQGRITREAVRYGLQLGYRHIDTARIYGNEGDVGQALRESGVPREDVFVVTKLWNQDHGLARARRAFENSLAVLGLDYVDLYLIHWPVEKRRQETWKALEEFKREGRARSIGVSNYTVRHLDELLAEAEIPPAVNQVEFHPFLVQRELLEHCRAHGIVLTAYSPLAHGEGLDDPTLASIGARHGKSAAQVMIRWAIQHGASVIPKSTRRERIHENALVFDFELGADEMRQIDALDRGHRTCWDPTSID
ncbi:MAG: aldo/keto reductase [Acidobacteria bacterium]|nr:aldo/keto reductase [Acidobacteriota bacterium]